MKTFKDNGIIIFCRYPEEDKVKTRLAESMGSEFAARFYKLCAENIFNECKKIISGKTSAYIFYSDKSQDKKIKSWIGNEFEFFRQHGDDLGARMENAFQYLFNEGVKKIIIIGTDIPDITSKLLIDAFEFLEDRDFVIAPTFDGGFYLLGMKTLYTGLFDNIKWSSGEVYFEIIKRLKRYSKNIFELDRLRDIDTGNDFKEWLQNANDNHPVKKLTRCLG